MPNMTDRSHRTLSILAEKDPAFTELCESLYGGVDLDVIYDDVFLKRAPDKDGDFQRKVAIGSNALGLTAGAAAIGSTLQDDRLLAGGKVSRGLYRTGQRIPAPIRDRVARMGPRGKALAAAGAVTLQGSNVAGDIVVSRTLPKPEKKGAFKKADPVKAPRLRDQARGAYAAATAALPEQYRPTANKAGRLMAVPLNHKKATVGAAAAAMAVNAQGKAKGRRQGYEEALYGKGDQIPDLELAGTFSKFDDDKRQAFGYASVVKKDGMPVIDRQGDYIDADEMEKAAYHYVQKSRKGGDMHRRARGPNGEDTPHHVSDLIESMVFTPEKCAAMGLPDEVSKKLEGHWWVGYQIHDEDTWQQVRKQGRTGFSIHGRGKRQDTTVDSVMGF